MMTVLVQTLELVETDYSPVVVMWESDNWAPGLDRIWMTGAEWSEQFTLYPTRAFEGHRV